MLERLLRSKAEVSVLGIVLFQEGLYLREIARMASLSPSEAKKELDNLVSLGVLRKKRHGNQVFFFLNDNCPFLNELKGLYLKTEGIFEHLRSSLKGVKGIKYTFIFGSMAKMQEKETSDLDLLVVGKIDEDVLAGKILNIQKGLKREINYILWSLEDLDEKIKKKSSFLKNIMNKKQIWLVGDKDEFIRVVEKGHNKKN